MVLRRHAWKPKLRSFKHRAVESLATQHMQNSNILHMNHIYTPKGVRLRIDKLLQQNKVIWNTSLSNELGRLTQGVRDIKENGAIIFAHKKMCLKPKK